MDNFLAVTSGVFFISTLLSFKNLVQSTQTLYWSRYVSAELFFPKRARCCDIRIRDYEYDEHQEEMVVGISNFVGVFSLSIAHIFELS